MASAALDISEDDAVARAPISLHPLFPAIVAVWFAALLGLGTLALPSVLLERLIANTGLAAALPAAAPPLGETARLLTAAAAGAAGALLGLFLARQVVRAHAPTSAPAPIRAASRRPISAHEELGDEGLGLFAGKDRAPGARFRMATADEDEFTPPSWLRAEPAEAQAPLADEPLDLIDFEPEPEAAWEDPAATVDGGAPEDTRMTAPDPIHAPAASHRAPVSEVPQPAAAPGPDWHPEWASAPLDSLGLVQLVQRLGASLERRRELARATGTAVLAPPLALDVEAAPAAEAAMAMEAYFGRTAAPASDTAAAAEPLPGTPRYATPADADEALRRALATLQRMSAAG